MGIEQLAGGGASRRRPIAYEGMIARDVPDVDEMLTVTLADFDDGRQLFGPCPWVPRADMLPARGDRCLVVFSDADDPWVVAWWPA